MSRKLVSSQTGLRNVNPNKKISTDGIASFLRDALMMYVTVTFLRMKSLRIYVDGIILLSKFPWWIELAALDLNCATCARVSVYVLTLYKLCYFKHYDEKMDLHAWHHPKCTLLSGTCGTFEKTAAGHIGTLYSCVTVEDTVVFGQFLPKESIFSTFEFHFYSWAMRCKVWMSSPRMKQSPGRDFSRRFSVKSSAWRHGRRITFCTKTGPSVMMSSLDPT